MHLELKDITDGCLERELTCAASDFPILLEMGQRDEAHFNKPIRFILRLQKTGQLVEVDGQLTADVVLCCGHCLQTFEKQLAADFAFTFTPYVADDQATPEDDIEIELDTDELGLVFYKDESLDLLQPLQDQLMMTLPISPTCKDDCRGLCRECGCNLNEVSCNCTKKLFINNFSSLAGLKLGSSDE